MANRLLLCLVFVCLISNFIECRGTGRGGGSRGGGGHTHSSGGSRSYPNWGWGSSSSSNSYKPSHSSSSWGSSSSGSGGYSYPYSSSGLSGSGGSSKPSYPSSSSGLSGSGTGGYSYPSSSSGLSGSGSGRPSYPSSSSGLSGYGSHTYPSAGSSGYGSHSYPSSSSGMSGSGYSSGTHNYPSSGTNNYKPSYDTSYRSSNSYNTYNTRHGSGSYSYRSHNNGYGSQGAFYNPPTYYTAPQYVYVNEYRNSESRFSDLLTGLTLYNLGRSHSNYHDHYYYDDYYRRRYNSPINSYPLDNTPKDVAVCTLKIKENGRLEVLKIPCEIVSTFTEGSRKVTPTPDMQVNKTVCVTNSTVINNTLPLNTPLLNSTVSSNLNITSLNSTVSSNGNATSLNSTISSNVTIVNSTTCTTSVNGTDPLTLKGPPVNASNMECTVEIKTKEAYFTHNVDCKTLMHYAKMPEPKKENAIMPSRSKLKSWLSNPPWWLSMFIAV